jgi:hypothetical protein
MLDACLCGALTGAVAGCLVLFGLRAWERRRRVSLAACEAAREARRETFSWTEQPLFRGKR